MCFRTYLHVNNLAGLQHGKKNMDSLSAYLFEVVFRDIPVPGETQVPSSSDRSIFIEVEPENVVPPAVPFGETARQSAKELAPQLAMQVVQKDLPHGFEPKYSVTEIDQLPVALHLCPPKFRGNRFRAWLT
jgi:hypothetical protein